MKLLIIIFNLLLLLSLLSPSLPCPLLLQAFRSVSNFPLPNPTTPCSGIRSLHLPSHNLSGTLSWMLLTNLSSLRSLDLSHNSLLGSIPGAFWSSSSLLHLNLASNRLGGPLRFNPSPIKHLNLSRNRFTTALDISSLSNLSSLDLSSNNLYSIPTGLNKLRRLHSLDVSSNSMTGVFPVDFPSISRLRFLNVSFNDLTGEVDSSTLEKFGSSAFINAGSLVEQHEHKRERHGRKLKIIVVVAVVSVSIVLALLCVVLMFVRRRMRRRRRKGWEEEEKGVKEAEEVPGWVAEARWGAEVVVFEKPLMEMTFADLAAATSGFGREAQMGEGGRSGAMYRAALPGDMEVVVRVVERGRGVEEEEEVAAIREVGRLRHPNLLPLLGFCIAGRLASF